MEGNVPTCQESLMQSYIKLSEFFEIRNEEILILSQYLFMKSCEIYKPDEMLIGLFWAKMADDLIAEGAWSDEEFKDYELRKEERFHQYNELYNEVLKTQNIYFEDDSGHLPNETAFKPIDFQIPFEPSKKDLWVWPPV